MKQIAFLLIALLMTVSLVSAAPITFKLGHIAEPENPYALGASHFAKLVKVRSGGEIIIEVFPSCQLGNQRELIEKVSLGTVDMALTGTAVLGNFIPEVSIFDLPFLFRNVEHAYKAIDTLGMELCNKGKERGFITLAIWENGIRHMTNNVRPIVTPDDMKGLNFRVMEQPVYIEMMKALGASPTPLAMSELYTALQQGVVDGQENPLAHIATKRFYEVQKYISFTAHTYAPEPLLISTVAWDKLSPAQQEILKKAAEDTRDWQRKLCRTTEQQFLAIIKDKSKCQMNDNVDKEAFAKQTRKVWELYTKRFGMESINIISGIK